MFTARNDKQWMKMITAIGIILLSLLLFSTAGASKSGISKDGLSWTLDDEGLLTISGEGNITDTPWANGTYSSVPGGGMVCDKDYIKKVIIEEGVTGIGKGVFNYYRKLTSIKIPKTVTYIDKFSFASDMLLEDLSIPDSVTSIGEDAFCGCDSLIEVTLPNSVTTLDRGAFSECDNLKRITLPKNLSTIANSRFYNCKNLESIIIPDKVTSIGDYAFSDCKNLKSVTLPNKLTTLGIDVFSRCVSLKRVDIPNGLKVIPNWTFNGCTNLKSVYLPKSIQEISSSAFSDCNKDKLEIYYQGTPADAEKIYGASTVTKKPGTIYLSGYESWNHWHFLGSDKEKNIQHSTISDLPDQTFSGKGISPRIKVTYFGTELKQGSDYTVSYKNNKAVGIAKVIITGKGSFSGTKEASFKIIPQGVEIASVTGAKKQITVKWKKGKNITGYEIQYSRDKDFTEHKSAKITKASEKSIKIKKLLADQQYYVRIRTYKKAGSETYYSVWSKVVNGQTK